MNALIVIPARYASTRFPGKPLADLAGKSLIRRVYDQALTSRVASAVWVATDDQRILEHVVSFGGRAIMTSSDLPSGTDRIAAALGSIERELGMQFDQVINVQGDEPTIDMTAVDQLMLTLQSDASIDVATLACPLLTEQEFRSRDVVKVVTDLAGNALYFSRAPIPHDSMGLSRRHIGLYGYQQAVLRRYAELHPTPLEIEEKLEQLRLLENGFRIRVLQTEKPHVGVDRPEDVARVLDELQKNG